MQFEYTILEQESNSIFSSKLALIWSSHYKLRYMLKEDKGAISNHEKQRDNLNNSISRQWDMIKLSLQQINFMANKIYKNSNLTKLALDNLL